MIAMSLVVLLGLSQFVSWGTTYYLIGVFGQPIIDELGWSGELVYGGFSVGLLTMAIASPCVGRLIDRFGGRWIMASGMMLGAVGCIVLSQTHGYVGYFSAWIVIGLAMRATLYDAAFATLVKIGERAAQKPITHITLMGGLASTCFWPLGHFLAIELGWRTALLCYAGMSMMSVPLFFAIPKTKDRSKLHERVENAMEETPFLSRRRQLYAAWLFAFVAALANALNAGMSAHMIALLADLGVGAAAAVAVSSFRGVGQSAARLLAVLLAGRMSPMDLNLLATLFLPISFGLAIFAAQSFVAAVTFALLYGAGNGVLSITRGTVPLAIFDPVSYGRTVGLLLMPAFLLSAAAPTFYAWVVAAYGGAVAVYVTIAMGLAAFFGGLLLKIICLEPRNNG